MNVAVFVIVLLLEASRGHVSSALDNAAGISKTAATISGYELLADGSIHKGKVRLLRAGPDTRRAFRASRQRPRERDFGHDRTPGMDQTLRRNILRRRNCAETEPALHSGIQGLLWDVSAFVQKRRVLKEIK